ncbi:MAG: antibiotic biosynthesis monooxygenase [Campylobacterales bacterium]|nr:antibiotic biosynthesis monooxygenase [Campylobacterales bacterium]
MAITKRVTFIAKEGCEFYEIVQYIENPRKFMAIETWRDEDALDGHRASAHYVVYKSSYEPYCEEKYTNELEVLG